MSPKVHEKMRPRRLLPRTSPDSIKLVAGRTGQEYNIRKNRKGAFWQDRYHATAVETNRHLRQHIAYIDMNMIRAGVADHPGKWECCGYNEIQYPRARKGIIDFDRLMGLLGFETDEQSPHSRTAIGGRLHALFRRSKP